MPWRRAILVVVGIVATAAIGLLVAPPLLLLHRTDLPLERAYGNAVVTTVARLFAGDAKNPLAGNARAIDAGRYAYTGSCASCHGANGDGKGVFGQDTYPPATDPTSAEAKQRSDAELFWITKNGLSFTGMPAFARLYKDEDIWALVSYLRVLQQGRASAISIPISTEAQLALREGESEAIRGRGGRD